MYQTIQSPTMVLTSRECHVRHGFCYLLCFQSSDVQILLLQLLMYRQELLCLRRTTHMLLAVSTSAMGQGQLKIASLLACWRIFSSILPVTP
jgi:hypothetical protein